MGVFLGNDFGKHVVSLKFGHLKNVFRRGIEGIPQHVKYTRASAALFLMPFLFPLYGFII